MADTEASELQDRTREVSARKVIVSEFVTLDGVMEDPSWTAPFTGQEQEQYKFDELSAADALLLGRTTYEEFAAAWPSMMEQYEGPRRAEQGKYADMMNAYPKHVVSTSLEEPLEWNNSTLMEGDVAEAVTRLKQQSGKDILVFGSGYLVKTLMGEDLIDEYRRMVFPTVVGSGKRLFADGIDELVPELVDMATFGTGVVVLTYRPASA
jgi:dihydrofolate reductase